MVFVLFILGQVLGIIFSHHNLNYAQILIFYVLHYNDKYRFYLFSGVIRTNSIVYLIFQLLSVYSVLN